MPKVPFWSPAERIDLTDYNYATMDFPRQMLGMHNMQTLLDKQSRIFRGFRIELADQDVYPGRITVHGGYAVDFSGNILFNSDQLTISRTLTFDGASLTFYVEVEFVEAESDVDARAFWDPTVDQTAPNLDGQEFYDNVSTRKTMDWIVSYNTSAFTRDTTPSSNKVPLIKLSTNGAGKITGVTTEHPKTTLLQQISTTKIRVQDAQLFKSGTGGDITVGAGSASPETKTVSAVYVDTGILEISALVGTHEPGEIIEATGSAAIDVIIESDYGRFRREMVGVSSYDYKDRMYQGDEVHGHVLTKGHDTANLSKRSDLNLRSLKDYVDFLSAQIQELKWGASNPYLSKTSYDRVPPGLLSNFPTTPRYFDRVGGLSGAKTVSITVGDGTTSFGDFNASDETGIQAAISSVPSAGSIYLKAGTYTINTNVTINRGVHFIADVAAVIKIKSGSFVINTTGSVCFENVHFERDSSATIVTGMSIETATPAGFVLKDCSFTNLSLDISRPLSNTTYVENCKFVATNVAMASRSLVRIISSSTGKLSGYWVNCLFSHEVASGLNGTCIDGYNGPATQGMLDISFINCKFYTKLNANSEQIRGGYGATYVLFDTCYFNSTGSTTTYHLAFANGGATLRILNCVGDDEISTFFYGVGITDLRITGYNNAFSVPKETIYITNGQNIIIQNSAFMVGSTSSFDKSAIFLEAGASGSLVGVLIDGCWISGDLYTSANKHGIGVTFKNSGGTLSDLKVVNNEFIATELGIYFVALSTLKYAQDVVISNNIFNDIVGGLTKAYTQKYGIYAGGYLSPLRWTIQGNKFINLNPDSVDGFGRAAIWFLAASSYLLVKDNIIRRCGATSYELTNTAAMIFNGLSFCDISDNEIDDVVGLSSTAGLICTTSSSQLVEKTKIINNIFEDISGIGSTSDVYGIYADHLYSTEIRNNKFRSLSTASSSPYFAYAVFTPDATGTNIEDTKLIGNELLNSANAYFYYLNTWSLLNVEICKNLVDSNCSVGFVIINGTSAYLYGCIISENECPATTTGDSGAISIEGTYTGGGAITISNNILGCSAFSCVTTVLATVNFTDIRISGNSLRTNSTTYPVIYLNNCVRVVVNGNHISSPDNVSSANLRFGAACDKFIISSNVCYLGEGSGFTLDLSLVGSAYGVIDSNLLDVAEVVGMPGTNIKIGDNQVF